MPPRHEITRLLKAWSDGRNEALEDLTPLVYDELHRLARYYLAGERRGHTLQATALVGEAYVRLIEWKNVHWRNRAHFFAVSARLMRHILVDHARSRHRIKRGGELRSVSIDETVVVSGDQSDDLIAVDEALHRLAKIDARKAKVVELRFFGGLGLQETADVLNVSHMTVLRDWDFAKAWMYKELTAATES